MILYHARNHCIKKQERGRLIQNPETGEESKPVPPAAMGQCHAMFFVTDSQAYGNRHHYSHLI